MIPTEYKILPHDTLHPSVMNSSWKRRASRDAGLTVIFYKREIEHLPKAKPLAAKDIFRRIDLTPKQLDSLKYKVELKSH
jgi:hypothetical protein